MLDTAHSARIHTAPQDVPHAPITAAQPSGSRSPAWYVVQTKPLAERRAYASLHRAGYQPYLPLRTYRTPCRHYRTAPLFPGYCFVWLDRSHSWYPIRNAPGVYSLLSVAGMPQPCARGVVEAVQATEALAATQRHDKPQWAPGDAVSVRTLGAPGVVLAANNKTARVAILMLGQLREITLPIEFLQPRQED